jgi:hypothetical protein
VVDKIEDQTKEKAKEGKESKSFKDLTIKGLNEGIYLQVKAEAIRRGMTIGEVMNAAMETWLKTNQLGSLKEWKFKIIREMRDLDEKMELAGAYSEESYKDTRKEYKRDIDRINTRIEKLEEKFF